MTTMSLVTGQTIVPGLDAVNTTLLLLTLAVSTLTFSSQRTNILLGAVHMLLLLAYIMLIFASKAARTCTKITVHHVAHRPDPA